LRLTFNLNIEVDSRKSLSSSKLLGFGQGASKHSSTIVKSASLIQDFKNVESLII